MTVQIDDFEITRFVQDQTRMVVSLELENRLQAVEDRLEKLEKDMNTLKSVFSFVFDDVKPEQ